MKKFYRVMLGKGGEFAEACLAGSFVGVDFGITENLIGQLPEAWRPFNQRFIPVYLAVHPGKSRVAAGLACGNLWTLAKGIRPGDWVLSSDRSGRFRVAEVVGEYFYTPGEILPHRRPVRWLSEIIDRADMSPELRRSAGSFGMVANLGRAGFSEEIERLIGTEQVPVQVSGDPTVEDAASFALEKHLEDFLVDNWGQTELGREYDIYSDEGESVGQQFPTDTGPLDILAISKDGKRLLVVEIKKGRASDSVVGQTLRYMGYVADELAEDGQMVFGAIIAHEDDPRIRRALAMTPNVVFYRYSISFKLVKT